MNVTNPVSTTLTSRNIPFLNIVSNDESIKILLLNTIIIITFFGLSGWLTGSRRTKSDLTKIFLIVIGLNWTSIVSNIKKFISNQTYVYAAVVCALQVSYASKILKIQHKANGFTQPQHDSKSSLRPAIFPCKTTHTRLFPSKHSFSYSYLYVGVPVVFEHNEDSGCPSDSSSGSSYSIAGWFSVHAEDYLERGVHTDGFKGELQRYLEQQGVEFNDYSFAYLVTAPRFLGFSFNPVSFWYLYDRDKFLRAMILEVNNTFDERRLYFMRSKSSNDGGGIDSKFSNEWEKDFHVSPFNDRAGSYSLHAIDPFYSNNKDSTQIDNNIVLKSPEGKPKLIARIFSTEPSLLPEEMSQWQMYLFILRWWWVGLMTNPRILREARVLWWKKKLQVFYRPEVMRTSIGRNETPEETKLEPYFRRFLQHISDELKLSFIYIPAAGPDRAKSITISSDQQESKDNPIEIKILTPAFYTEIVRSNDLSTTFEKFCFNPSPGEAMIYTSNPDALYQVLHKSESVLVTMGSQSKSKPLEFHLTVKVMLLRLANWILHHGESHKSFSKQIKKISSQEEMLEYDAISMRICIADKVALGSTSLLNFYITCIWYAFCVALARQATGLFLQQENDARFIEFGSICGKLFVMNLLRRLQR